MNGPLTRNNLLTPESLFKECMFRVPDYQRGYAWGPRQRDELLEDLGLLAEGKAHYTGTLVLHAFQERGRLTDKHGNSYSMLDIVDGQQRLTTIILLLDAIRESLGQENQADLAQGIIDRYVGTLGRNGQLMPKLTLNRDCHQFFLERVVLQRAPVAGPTIRSHQNVADAFTEFRRFLAGKKQQLSEGYVPWLMSFRDKACQQLFFTVYVVDEAAEVGVIFEVMNNRGLHITELEKVKNYLLYLGSKLQLEDHNFGDIVNTTWTHIFENLMRSGLTDPESEDRLLRMHWHMAYDYSPKSWQGSRSVKDQFHLRDYVGRHKDLLRDLKEYVSTLKDATTAFCDVENPGRSDAFNSYTSDADLRSKIALAGEKLRRLRVLVPFMPVLMAIRLRFPDNGDAYLKALELCEIYSFRVYSALEYRADAGRSTLFTLGYGLYVGQSELEQTLRLLVALVYKYSPDDRFDRECELVEENDWYNWSGLKYFLYEYESHLAKGTPVRMAWSTLEQADKKETVEHILPQTPEEGYWTERFPADNRKKYTHDIGNLCLTFDNSSYGRKKFSDKKGTAGSDAPCYANGKLFMERELAKVDDWTVDALLKRRKKIIGWAKKRWALPGVSKAVDVPPPADEGEPDDADDNGTE
jgi:hypothetical protein